MISEHFLAARRRLRRLGGFWNLCLYSVSLRLPIALRFARKLKLIDGAFASILARPGGSRTSARPRLED